MTSTTYTKQSLIEIANKKNAEYKKIATDALYAEHSNNAVEANNQLPYIFDNTWFDQDFKKIEIKDGVVFGYFHLIGEYQYSIEKFLKAFDEEINNLDVSDLLVSFVRDPANWTKKEDNHSLISCQSHEEVWVSPKGTWYKISLSHWQGEHLSEDDFEEVEIGFEL